MTVQLPAGSRVEAKAAAAELRGVGRLGDVTFEGAQAVVKLDEAASARLTLQAGDMLVGRLTGPAASAPRRATSTSPRPGAARSNCAPSPATSPSAPPSGVSATLDAGTAYGRIHNTLQNTARRHRRPEHPRDHRLRRHHRPQPLTPPAVSEEQPLMTNLAIAANGLRKSYGDKTVLDGIDLAVPEGTVFSLLGPNGAGKTTAVKILSTLISAGRGLRRRSASAATTWPPTRRRSAPRSASPGSSPPWTA